MIREEHRSILVLDRDGDSRTLVEGVLILAHYRVVPRPEPAEPADPARAEMPDLVLADIGSDVMEAVPHGQRRKTDREAGGPAVREGYAVLRALGADPRAPCYAVVLLKDQELAGVGVRRPRFGVVDYVAKPVAKDALLVKLREVFRDAERRGAGEAARRAPAADPDLELAPERDAGPPAQALTSPGFEALPAALRIALVVDAEDSFRDFLRSLLVSQGFTVYEAGDGEEGLRVALAIRPWLILTDVNMPGMDGFEFCRRVRNHSLLRQTPLVFLSEWDDYRERYHGLTLGADDYLSKRTPPREMLIRMQIILRRYTDVRTRKGAGMQGGLELIGAPGILQMCHLGRFSGTCTVRSGPRRIEIRFRDGEIVWARSDVAAGAEAIYEFISWTRGHFEFLPGDPGAGAPLGEGFEHLLLEGCRRLDEASLHETAADDDESLASRP